MSNSEVGTSSPTIYDVAKELGISASTVSRALHKPGRTSAATEARVRQAAKALGYRINPLARALPTGRTYSIALVVSDITNPVFAPLVRGAELVAAERGFTMVLAESQESPDVEFDMAMKLAQSTDGLILVAARLSDQQIQEVASRVPLMLVNREVESISSVVPDVTDGVNQALDHVQRLGHRSIAYISGPEAAWVNTQRWNLLLDKAVSRGTSIVSIGPTAPTVEGGEEVFRRLRASGASVAIAYNDLIAVGILRAYADHGLSAPEDISVIGFDDILASRLVSPSLSTLHSPLMRAGQAAADRLVAEIEGTAGGSHTKLAAHFVERDSTGLHAAASLERVGASF